MSKKKKKKTIIAPIMPSAFDPLGSYTGYNSFGIVELPEQDADDL